MSERFTAPDLGTLATMKNRRGFDTPAAVAEATIRYTGGIQNTAHLTWEGTYRNTIPEDVRRRFVERAYSTDSLKRRIEADVFLVAVEDDEILGFADFHPVSGRDGEVELAAIYVLPGMQGRGIGTQLLKAGLDKLTSARNVRLRVERNNHPARRFYERHGFTEVGEHREQLFGHDFHEVEMKLRVAGRGG